MIATITLHGVCNMGLCSCVKGSSGDPWGRQPGTEEAALMFPSSLIEAERLLRKEPTHLIVLSGHPCFRSLCSSRFGRIASNALFTSRVRSDRVLLAANALSTSSVSSAVNSAANRSGRAPKYCGGVIPLAMAWCAKRRANKRPSALPKQREEISVDSFSGGSGRPGFGSGIRTADRKQWGWKPVSRQPWNKVMTCWRISGQRILRTSVGMRSVPGPCLESLGLTSQSPLSRSRPWSRARVPLAVVVGGLVGPVDWEMFGEQHRGPLLGGGGLGAMRSEKMRVPDATD